MGARQDRRDGDGVRHHVIAIVPRTRAVRVSPRVSRVLSYFFLPVPSWVAVNVCPTTLIVPVRLAPVFLETR